MTSYPEMQKAVATRPDVRARNWVSLFLFRREPDRKGRHCGCAGKPGKTLAGFLANEIQHRGER